MTQVKEMTNTELNRALAELMGYGVYITPGDHFCLIQGDKNYLSGICDDEITAWKQAPDYCTDPAASLEVQEKAMELDYKAYIQNMQMLRWNRTSSRLSLWDAANLMLATPRERSEAAYMVLSQVRE